MGLRSFLIALLTLLLPGMAVAQTASITTNRGACTVSGQAPLAVIFDGTGSNCDGDGTSGEWQDDVVNCLYEWDFDDDSPDYEYGAAAHAGQAVDADTDRGPIAAHVFEDAGTYTVGLTITQPDGDQDSETCTVSVSAFSGTTFCVSTDGDTTGCTGTAVTTSNFATAIGASGCNLGSTGDRRCRFKRGQTWTSAGNLTSGSGNTLIDAYGSGNRPIITGSGGYASITGPNVKLVDLDLTGACQLAASHKLVLRSRIRDCTPNEVSGYGSNYGNMDSNNYLFRTVIEDITGWYGIYGYFPSFAFVGGAVIDSGRQSESDKGPVRTGGTRQSVFAHSEFGPSISPGASHIFRLTGERFDGGTGADEVVFRDNRIVSNQLWALKITPQYPGAYFGDDGQIQKVLVEDNFFQANSGSDGGLALFSMSNDVTFRNNVCQLADSGDQCIEGYTEASNNATRVYVIGNTAYYPAGNNAGPAFDIPAGLTNIYTVNNLLYAGSGNAVSCGGSSCTTNSNNTRTATERFINATLNDFYDVQLAADQDDGATRSEAFFDASGGLRTVTYDAGAWEFETTGGPTPACSDGIDNDGDGFTDYSATPGAGDPGCTSAEDTSELGTTECDDGLDNDSDGQTDYPDDLGCHSPLDDDESDPTDSGSNFSLRFYGHGTGQIDRVKIPIDNPAREIDVANDFTVEFWMKAASADGTSDDNCATTSDAWITGDIIIDRDIFGANELGDYGISMAANGLISAGVNNGAGFASLCSTTAVDDSEWHHVAFVRDGTTVSLYIDGVREDTDTGPTGSIAYTDGRSTSYPDSDPYLVFGAEKHDAGVDYPSYNGLLDEVRISASAVYSGASFSIPTTELSASGAVGMYRFDEGPAGDCTGTVLDGAGTADPGACMFGGSEPDGPVYSTDVPPIYPPATQPVLQGAGISGGAIR